MRRPLLLALLLATLAAASPTGAANPIPQENLLGASTRWGPFGPSAIAGYASESSLSQGDTLHLHVSATPGLDYRVELYRLGWYSGTGGRLMGCLPTCVGFSETCGRTSPTPPTAYGWTGPAGMPTTRLVIAVKTLLSAPGVAAKNG